MNFLKGNIFNYNIKIFIILIPFLILKSCKIAWTEFFKKNKNYKIFFLTGYIHLLYQILYIPEIPPSYLEY